MTATPAVTEQKKAPPLRVIEADGSLTLNLHWGQRRAYHSKARFMFMLAGKQSGKTSSGPHWLYKKILEARDRMEDPSQGVGDFLAVASTYDQFRLKMRPEMLEVLVNIHHVGRYHAKSRIIELTENVEPGGRFWAKKQEDPMYGRIILRSADAFAGLVGTTAKAAWLDEVVPRSGPL